MSRNPLPDVLPPGMILHVSPGRLCVNNRTVADSDAIYMGTHICGDLEDNRTRLAEGVDFNTSNMV